MQSTVDIHYGLEWYERYQAAHGADAAKKSLELLWTDRTLCKWGMTRGKSADFGCASGRYPFWLASRGFDALGVDKSEEAIRFCRERSAATPPDFRVTFRQLDIETAELPSSHFALITSMMGTMNHIASSYYDTILSKYLDSLTSGGGLILSCWNPLSPYLEFLSLYNAEERQYLLRNSVPSDSMKSLLRRIGFASVEAIYFCGLPDICYDSWEGRSSDNSLARIDNYLIDTHGLGESCQMYLVVARKP